MRLLSFKFILALMVVPFGMQAQCKYVKNSVDKFTNKTEIETKSVIAFKGYGSAATFSLIKSDTARALKLGLNYGTTYSILKGGKLYLKFKDEVIVLECLKYVVETGYSEPAYFLSAAHLQKLQGVLLTDVRIELSDANIDVLIDAKNAVKLQSMFNCVN